MGCSVRVDRASASSDASLGCVHRKEDSTGCARITVWLRPEREQAKASASRSDRTASESSWSSAAYRDCQTSSHFALLHLEALFFLSLLNPELR